MCLLDIDQIEFYMILESLMELVKGGNLPAKRWSGIAPEY
jgi:hypothetical protein